MDHPVLQKVVKDLEKGTFLPKYYLSYLKETGVRDSPPVRETFISEAGLLYPAKKTLISCKDFYSKDADDWYIKLKDIPSKYEEISWEDCAPKESLSHLDVIRKWTMEFGPIFDGYVSDMDKILKKNKFSVRPSLINAYDYFNSLTPFPINKFKFVSAEYIYVYPVI